MLQSSTLNFLTHLEKNNQKEWFEKNKQAYQAAKLDFENFIQEVINRFGLIDPTIHSLTAKSCMFRINRDVRFSKDKSPYKNNFGASINSAGRKATYGGYYFHLQPGSLFAGGGIWMPEPDKIQKIRQEIDYNFSGFKSIISSTKFVKTFGGLSKDKAYTLSRVPKGYDTNNIAAEYLKLKSWVAITPIPDADATGGKLVDITVDVFKTLQPLIGFINTALAE